MNLVKTDEAPLRAFIEEAESLSGRLAPHGREEDLKAIQKLIDNFRRKTEDFFRENRKLNIGVLGQVKAGKSSFLNALLFDGKEILPKASTPKTATLTRMEYAEENAIEIEYYSADEWSVIEENAKIESDEDVYSSARELVRMIRHSGLDPAPLLKKGTERLNFGSYEELLGQLNSYVGEDGKYTPLVKSVTLYLHNDAFQGLSIVDTPGLNDPIASRTLRTKEFIELCDVVFFLSQSSTFLDQNDWTLLSTQLPQKGVKRLTLIASKYDSGLRDILRRPSEDDDLFGPDENTASNIPDACKLVKRKLRKRARTQVDGFVKDLESRDASPDLIRVIQGCGEPILISSMAEHMSRQPVDAYSPEEKNVYEALRQFSRDIQADLRGIGNLNQVREIFDSVVREKETILQEKAAGFVPTARQELKDLLEGFRKKAEGHVQMLENGSKKELAEQRQAMERQIGSVKAAIAEAFGELETEIETQKGEGVRDMRRDSSNYSNVQERTGERTEWSSHRVSDAVWYNPFSWGRSHTVRTAHTVHYNYCLAADAVENIRRYSVESSNRTEQVFSDAVNLKGLKRKLLQVIVQNFETGSENYDASFFRLVVERTVNAIELPTIHIDISDAMNGITSKFTGELTSADEKTALTAALSNALSSVYMELSRRLETSARELKSALENLQDGLQASLLKSINDEFDLLLAECENKDREIAAYQGYVVALKTESARL